MSVAVVSRQDQPLYAIVSGAAPATIEDVLRAMRRIDELLADGDGLKWYTRLYMMVTKEVDLSPTTGGRKDARWLLGLVSMQLSKSLNSCKLLLWM